MENYIYYQQLVCLALQPTFTQQQCSISPKKCTVLPLYGVKTEMWLNCPPPPPPRGGGGGGGFFFVPTSCLLIKLFLIFFFLVFLLGAAYYYQSMN